MPVVPDLWSQGIYPPYPSIPGPSLAPCMEMNSNAGKDKEKGPFFRHPLCDRQSHRKMHCMCWLSNSHFSCFEICFYLFQLDMRWISVLFMDHLMPGTANNNNNKKQSNITNEKTGVLLTLRMLHCSCVYPPSENMAHVPMGRRWNMPPSNLR